MLDGIVAWITYTPDCLPVPPQNIYNKSSIGFNQFLKLLVCLAVFTRSALDISSIWTVSPGSPIRWGEIDAAQRFADRIVDIIGYCAILLQMVLRSKSIRNPHDVKCHEVPKSGWRPKLLTVNEKCLFKSNPLVIVSLIPSSKIVTAYRTYLFDNAQRYYAFTLKYLCILQIRSTVATLDCWAYLEQSNILILTQSCYRRNGLATICHKQNFRRQRLNRSQGI